MKTPVVFVVISCIIARTESRVRGGLRNRFTPDDEEIHVIVGFKSTDGEGKLTGTATKTGKKLKKAKAIGAVIPKSKLKDLQENPDVLYVEEDGMVYPDSQTTPYGLTMIQTEVARASITSNRRGSSCRDPNSFKIGIIDSGLAVDHPDIPCLPIDDPDTNCIGAEFAMTDSNDKWYNPQRNAHGTHVAGTISALSHNSAGVEGVIGDGDVCLIIARVFGESGGGTRMSAIYEAVEWTMQKGAHVINLSLGGSRYSQTGEELFMTGYRDGHLFVAAAGNDGGREEHYPASFTSVISVAAIDEAMQRASFSQYNDAVDLAAPGVSVLSTKPVGNQAVAIASVGAFRVIGKDMVGSSTQGAVGTLIECPNFGLEKCPGPGGHVCLIERGLITFEDKVLSCERGGGIAAIIYNSMPEIFTGALANPTRTTIAAVGISSSSGASLKKEFVGQVLTLTEEDGYGLENGTSMASPHVAGSASLIWRACPDCSNRQVEDCLMSTALDLGQTGRDDEYGNGLVQTDAAYQCLKTTFECCPETPPSFIPTSPPTDHPTEGPSYSPSLAPSDFPSLAPSDFPSLAPSDFPSLPPVL